MEVWAGRLVQRFYDEVWNTASLPVERSQPTWSEVRLTLRWRKPDSNRRSPLKKGQALPRR